MLKATHASEDIAAAREKAIRVIEKLRGLRLTRAAELVEAAVEETLTYYPFPEEHWLRIRTNKPARAHPARDPAAHACHASLPPGYAISPARHGRPSRSHTLRTSTAQQRLSTMPSR